MDYQFDHQTVTLVGPVTPGMLLNKISENNFIVNPKLCFTLLYDLFVLAFMNNQIISTKFDLIVQQ